MSNRSIIKILNKVGSNIDRCENPKAIGRESELGEPALSDHVILIFNIKLSVFIICYSEVKI